MNYYNFYGNTVLVEGRSIESAFQLEFGKLEIDPLEIISIRVVPNKNKRKSMVYPKGMKRGISFEFHKDTITLYYEAGVNVHFIIYWFEALLEWKDKTFAHAGCVASSSGAIAMFAASNVGKTSTVIELLRRGYSYVSDDWVIVGNGYLYVYPKTMHVFDYNLALDKQIAESVSNYPKLLSMYMNIRMQSRKLLQKYAPHRSIRYAANSILNPPMMYVQPENLVSSSKMSDKKVPINIALWLRRYNGKSIRLESISSSVLSNRINNISFHERANMYAKIYYEKALQLNGKNASLGDELLNRNDILKKSLNDKVLYELLIPYKTRPLEIANFIEKIL